MQNVDEALNKDKAKQIVVRRSKIFIVGQVLKQIKEVSLKEQKARPRMS